MISRDEQEAQSIRYASRFMVAKLSSGKYALYNAYAQSTGGRELVKISNSLAEFERYL